MNLTGLLQERWKMLFIYNVIYKSTDYKYHQKDTGFRNKCGMTSVSLSVIEEKELKNLLYESSTTPIKRNTLLIPLKITP